MNNLISLITGTLFGLGLGFAGMMSPEKVKGFLDITRNWDPSLGLVMGGALAVTFVSFPLILKKGHPMLDTKFYMPTAKEIDHYVVIGPAIFGTGWALAGTCPGPGIANLATGTTASIAFVATLFFFFVITDFIVEKTSK